MLEKIKSNLNVFWQLLKTDLIIFKKYILGKFINTTIWVVFIGLLFIYVMPQLGLAKDFGSFWIVGSIASCAMFEIFPSVAELVADLSGNNTTSYYLTLPVSNAVIFLEKMCLQAIKSMTIATIVLPLGKIMLWNKTIYTNFSISKFIPMFLILNLFYGAFALFTITLIKDMAAIDNIWGRILFPLWFFGGADFSWKILNGLSPILSYLAFLNPVIYTMEGIRSTVLGQTGYLNFGLCLAVLIGFTFAFALISIIRFKKRLDWV